MSYHCCGEPCQTRCQSAVRTFKKCVRFDSVDDEEDEASSWSPPLQKTRTSQQYNPTRHEFMCKRVYEPSQMMPCQPSHNLNYQQKHHHHHQHKHAHEEAWERYAVAMQTHCQKQYDRIETQEKRLKKLSERNDELQGRMKELQEAADEVEERLRAQMHVQKKQAFDDREAQHQMIWKLQSDKERLQEEIGRWWWKLEQSERHRRNTSQFMAVQTKKLDPFCY